MRFDDSLPAFAKVIADSFGVDALTSAVFIRDAKGVLAAVLDRELDDTELVEVQDKVLAALGPYARAEEPVRGKNGIGAERLLSGPARLVKSGGVSVRLIDRRIVGIDWLAPPKLQSGAVPRVVFFSIKGGVGRSTALCVCAAHLARKGLRVLAIDLDFEAPGLGATLLRTEELPKYGVVDWLVENGISGIDQQFLADSIGHSSLMAGMAVLPAFGTATLNNPADALSKIARASIEDTAQGVGKPFREQVREMVERCEQTGDFDVVLVDARAGLHETTAAPLLNLGAKVLMFGLDEPQTFQGYKLLLAHIDERRPDSQAWREQAWLVQAKAPQLPDTGVVDRFRTLWGDTSNVIGVEQELSADDLDVEWNNDETAVTLPDEPAPLLWVLDDGRYRGFDPLRAGELLSLTLVNETFRSLIEWFDDEVVRVANQKVTG
jgi:cellulose biosynthesis protein BcsQ